MSVYTVFMAAFNFNLLLFIAKKKNLLRTCQDLTCLKMDEIHAANDQKSFPFGKSIGKSIIIIINRLEKNLKLIVLNTR